MLKFKQYKRKGLSEIIPFSEFVGMDMSNISVSEQDKLLSNEEFAKGYIARNPKNHADMWYVAKKYFDDNLEPVGEISKPMTYREAQNLLDGLLRSKSVKVQTQDKFAYAWGKNYDKLVSIQKLIEKKRYPPQTKDTEAFMKEIGKIDSILKERGVTQENYQAEYKIEADKVEAKFPDVKKYYDDHAKAFEAFLDTEFVFEPYILIDMDNMPEMTLEQRAGISFMLQE